MIYINSCAIVCMVMNRKKFMAKELMLYKYK